MVARALSGGGDPVSFEGEFYQVTELTPGGTNATELGRRARPKALAVTVDTPPGGYWHLADWRSTLVPESRPIVDEAAASVGRPCRCGHHLQRLQAAWIRHRSQSPATRGRWIGGGVTLWVEELTYAVLEVGRRRLSICAPPGERISDTT